MPDLASINYFELAKTVTVAFGGPVAIVIVLAGFFGKIFSEGRIKKIENQHKGELEEKKAELEKAKSQFFRYSEEQFKLYNSLWKILMMTKSLADDLWTKADPKKLPSFAQQIELTRKAVMDSMLLIEEEHYNDLDSLLTKFEQFQFGKQKLINIRSNESQGVELTVDASHEEVAEAIKNNGKLREDYTKLIMKIGKSFREQIRG